MSFELYDKFMDHLVDASCACAAPTENLFFMCPQTLYINI